MNTLLSILALLLHAALLLAAAPLLTGALDLTRARLTGHAGPPLLQPWRRLARLLQKQPTLPESASPLFRAAPIICLATTATAALLVPSFTLGMATAPLADLLVIAGLLAFARITLILAALDPGAALPGLAATRTATIATFAVPAFALAIFAAALAPGSTNLDQIATLPHPLPAFAIALVALAEPTPPDPSGLAEYSGRDLAILDYAAQLRRLVWLTLVALLLAPPGASLLAWPLGLLAYVVKVTIFAAALLLLDLALPANPAARLGLATLLAFLAALFLFTSQSLA